jgi:hypothetical protein
VNRVNVIKGFGAADIMPLKRRQHRPIQEGLRLIGILGLPLRPYRNPTTVPHTPVNADSHAVRITPSCPIIRATPTSIEPMPRI